MNFKDKMYYLVVEKKPEIKKNYEEYVNQNLERHYKHRLKSWLYLLSLHILYWGKNSGNMNSKSDNNLSYPETGIEPRVSTDVLVSKLEKFDIISFDIFDTLILRAISNPKSLFILIGNRLKITEFKTFRELAEMDARKKHPEVNGEISIEDIYELLEQRCGLDKETGIKEELRTELEFCFANPYMMEVAQKLHDKGKKIIATSNMYWNKNNIKKILDSCGYGFISDIYVSCEYKCSKYKGELQKKIWNEIGHKNKVIHVGDNYNVDFIGSRMAGWKAFYYKNVNEIGAPYRPYGMTELFGSIYSGLVNAKFHNGILKPDKYYELGYAYGGPLTTGYCQWINEYAKNNKIDKILFTSRDMYCVHQVYNSFFKKYDNDYIAISRFAAQRFSYKSFSEYFIDTHIRARAGIEKLTVREALEELEINALYSFLDDYGLKESQLLDMSIYENLKQCMEDHKTEILNEFQEEKEAAIKYYSQFVSKGQRIAVVDLGWQGSNALCLKYLLEKETNLNVEVFSLLMCATGKSFLNHSLSAGIQKAYCFSPQKNSSLMGHFSHHNIGRFLCEMIFTSEEESLKKFEIDEGRIKIVRMPTERRNSEHLKRIISGITDYAREFNNLKIDSSELFVSGLEVILPINKLSYNEKFCINILKEVEVNPWIGVLKNSAASNIEKIVR